MDNEEYIFTLQMDNEKLDAKLYLLRNRLETLQEQVNIINTLLNQTYLDLKDIVSDL